MKQSVLSRFCAQMESFIEAVRAYPCLWNLNDNDYRRGDKKEMAWKKIVHLKIPEITDVKTAKSEWKKLRDNHRDSLKRLKSGKTGQSATNDNRWRYAKIMEFLLPYMKTRKRSINLTSTEDTNSNSDPVNTSTLDTETQDPTQDEESNLSVPLEESDITAQQAPTPRKRRNDNCDDEIIKIIREMQSSRQEEINKKDKRDKHPIETFFHSMAQTAKSLPLYLQNRIKIKTLQIVCEAEEEYESYACTSYGYSSSSNSMSVQSPGKSTN